jgi:hypothetical protein
MSDNTLGVEIQRIRDRLRAMRTEREAAMTQLVESREIAESHRQVSGAPESARDQPPAPDSAFLLSP